LVDEKTGQPLRNLVTNDRLKKFDVDRQEFNEKLPKIETGKDRPIEPLKHRPKELKPIEIMSKSRIRGKLQYRVHYTDDKVYLCDCINKALLDHYDCKMAVKDAQISLSDGRHNRKHRH